MSTTGDLVADPQDEPAQPTDAERWVSEGGWLVDLLLARTDRAVLVQAVVVVIVFAVLLRPARRAALVQLWLGGAVLTASLILLRGALILPSPLTPAGPGAMVLSDGSR